MASRLPPNPVALDALRRWAVLLDSRFRVPGTSIRFGLDAIVGLIPGIGDISTPVFAALLLLQAVRMRLPLVVQARMVFNAAIDMLMGLVPILGDLVDIGWKANLRNLALLERHARPGVLPSRGDYLFVVICVGVLALIAITPVVLLVWLLSRWPLLSRVNSQLQAPSPKALPTPIPSCPSDSSLTLGFGRWAVVGIWNLGVGI